MEIRNYKIIPQQNNGYDCGVFCFMFAKFIAADKQLLFLQEDVTSYCSHMKIMITNTDSNKQFGI